MPTLNPRTVGRIVRRAGDDLQYTSGVVSERTVSANFAGRVTTSAVAFDVAQQPRVAPGRDAIPGGLDI